jgi:hypothetical protein
VKVVDHPRVGRLRIEPLNMWLTRLGSARATIYTAVDDESEAKFRRLLED